MHVHVCVCAHASSKRGLGRGRRESIEADIANITILSENARQIVPILKYL